MRIRNCAWTEQPQQARKIVWTRAGIVTGHCPKSLITAQSLEWLEMFFAWKALGGGVPWSMHAKSVDALLVLERAWRMENQREQH